MVDQLLPIVPTCHGLDQLEEVFGLLKNGWIVTKRVSAKALVFWRSK